MMCWVGHELGGQTRSSEQEKVVGGSAIRVSCARVLVGIQISGWGRGFSLRERDACMRILASSRIRCPTSVLN